MSPAALASTADIIAPSDPENPTPESGWQAGTCNTDLPAAECNVDSPQAQFYEEASGHPPKGFTQFIVKHQPPGKTPVGELATIRVDLPVGLSVNPGATPQCPLATFEASPATCNPQSKVGESRVTGSAPPLGLPVELPGIPVYNIVPKFGEPALFGFELGGNDVFLEADVAWHSDYHEGFTIHVPHAPNLGAIFGAGGLVLENRLVFDGIAGDGTFITTPATCLGEAKAGSPFVSAYSTWLLANSVAEEENPAYRFPQDAFPAFESRIPPGTSPKNCDTVPFDPSIAVSPHTGTTDSPSRAAVTVNLPHRNGLASAEQETSQVKAATVTLPGGMGLNPSAANGLVACTDDQFGKGTRADVACPAASKVGRVTISTPPLPEGPLTGDVYVGTPTSNDPTSGNLYRLFVAAESPRYGISARLIGNVSANPLTGQLSTTFNNRPLDGLPQVPFSEFTLDFDDGPRAPLSSPPTCGPNATNSQMTPWTATASVNPAGAVDGPSDNPPATPSNEFALSHQPNGNACAKTMAERPFAPAFGIRTQSARAGEFSPLTVSLARPDGEQELKVVDLTLPPGYSARLKGVKYCPEAAIARAATNSGGAEAVNASCPPSSFIGSATVKSGTGSEPLQIQGKAFLSGPYHGAPLSLVFVTPATAGPFDLGSVVVRVALFVDPETARVRALSDPIPHVFGGALLGIRSIVVKTERKNFSLNPTNCSKMAAGGTLRGGGADPLNPATFSAFKYSDLLEANACKRLKFKPKLNMRIFGGTKRAKNPKLRAVLRARRGDANIGRAAVALPKYFFLDQASLSKICTRVQFAANDCPRNSIYGHAKAFSPLLDKPVKGPVYLRSSNNPLPDLVAKLRGQVEVHLVGRTDSVKGRIRNTFDRVPDVPVKRFILTIRGGKKGLLVNSTNICKLKRKQLKVIANFKAQNDKKRKLRPKLRTPCGKKKQRR